jgi:gamma-glutamylcyclotransferase (GGCT)/AIG2-like uncharacterized protein YtfP
MNSVYFAFGSNLSGERMLRRCPSAVLLGAGSLRGYRLVFAGFSCTWNGSVATIVPARGECVPGLLYRISRADLARLDAFEGAPLVYTRRQRMVLDRRAGTARRAHVYEFAEVQDLGEPSFDYVLTILRAYREHGLATGALSSALAMSREASQ